MPRRNRFGAAHAASMPSSNSCSYLLFLRPTLFAMAILYGVTVIQSSLLISVGYESNNNLNSPILDAPMMKRTNNNNKSNNNNKPTLAATLPQQQQTDIVPKTIGETQQQQAKEEPEEELEPENKEERQTTTMSKEHAEILERIKAVVANEPKHEGTVDEDGIDWSDDIFKREGWNNDPIVVEKYKLLFFTIPKNACSTFNQLFRRMMGIEDWLTGDLHNPRRNGLEYFGKYPKQRQKEMLLDPTWTRAIFVRDPLERTLSAYMDKGLQGSGHEPWVGGAHVKRECCNLGRMGAKPKFEGIDIKACHSAPLKPYSNDLTVANFPFEHFIRDFMTACPDHHWMPQHKRLSAPSNYRFINFVGNFETKMEDTHRLLKQIGAFDEFGSSGWGTETVQETDETTGQTVDKTKSLAVFEKNHAGHQTGSTQYMDLYYSDSLRRLVYEYYKRDYELELYNLTKPKLVL